eukprot:553064-Hanusia_phi.AAC.1
MIIGRRRQRRVTVNARALVICDPKENLGIRSVPFVTVFSLARLLRDVMLEDGVTKKICSRESLCAAEDSREAIFR